MRYFGLSLKAKIGQKVIIRTNIQIICVGSSVVSEILIFQKLTQMKIVQRQSESDQRGINADIFTFQLKAFEISHSTLEKTTTK